MSETDLTRAGIVDAVRAFLLGELIRDASVTLGEDDALLSAGLITSFDLVSITVFLERRFGVVVPDACVSRERLDSVRQIADLVESLRGTPHAAVDAAGPAEAAADAGAGASWDPIARAMPSFRRAPVLAALGIIAGLGLVELSARAVLERPAGPGSLLEIDSRRMCFDFPDYEEALRHHDLARTPRGRDEVRIVFQGDSGTYGIYHPPEDACPAVMGRILCASDPHVRVYNVSYFNQSLVKEAEILEAVLPYQPALIVLSVSSAHLDLGQQWDCLAERQPTVVGNRPLFERFLRSATPGPELAELDAALAGHERAEGMGTEAWLRPLVRRSALASNRLLLRRGLRRLTEQWLPADLRPRIDGADAEARIPRRYRGKTTADFASDVPYPLDRRQVVLLDAIVARARAAGSEVAIFVEPEATLPGPGGPRRIPWNDAGWSAMQEAFEGVARRHHATLVNARDVVPPDEFLDTDHHWSAVGHRAIGEVLARELAPIVARIERERR